MNEETVVHAGGAVVDTNTVVEVVVVDVVVVVGTLHGIDGQGVQDKPDQLQSVLATQSLIMRGAHTDGGAVVGIVVPVLDVAATDVLVTVVLMAEQVEEDEHGRQVVLLVL